MSTDHVVGTGTPASRLKALYHASMTEKSHLRLKAFARSLAKDGTDEQKQLVQDWQANKHGALDQPRSDANIALASTCSSTTKTGRRKKRGQ